MIIISSSTTITISVISMYYSDCLDVAHAADHVEGGLRNVVAVAREHLGRACACIYIYIYTYIYMDYTHIIISYHTNTMFYLLSLFLCMYIYIYIYICMITYI